MDGTLAIIFIVAGLTDMGFNDCPDQCLRQTPATERFNLQAGQVIFQEDTIGEEIYAAYDLGTYYGPFQPTVGISGTMDGDYWVGAGAKWTSKNISPGPFFFEASLMPGLYAQGDGPDIGGALQFRSALGMGYQFDNGGTLSVLFDHRSNADTQEENPGLETLAVRYAIALN